MDRSPRHGWFAKIRLSAVFFTLMAGLAQADGLSEFSDCQLTSPPLPPVAADCATLTVSENPSGTGRTIDLAVARINSTNKEKQPDPVIFFAGGPGQAALEAYPMVAGALASIRSDRDIVLMDQRGTGQSNPLDCPLDESQLLQSIEEIDWQGYVQSCLDNLEADTRYYATRHAVEDVEAFRVALGVDQLNLVGGSYGTRMASSYAKQYPERVRSMVLFGVVPHDEPLGVSHAINLESALQRMFDRCENSEVCSSTFGDVGEQLDQLRARLAEEDVDLTLLHPVTGESTSFPINDEVIAIVVRLLSYSSEGLSLLPLLIHEASTDGRMEPLAGQALMVLASLGEQISHGMELSVICSEDLPFFPADTSANANTVLGDSLVTVLREQCKYWPTDPADASFKTPLTTDIPTLLISGEFDPVTPPVFADRAAASLSNVRNLVAPGQGHNSLTPGCVPKLVVEFIEANDPSALDAKCLDVLGPAPFFTSFSGPQP